VKYAATGAGRGFCHHIMRPQNVIVLLQQFWPVNTRKNVISGGYDIDAAIFDKTRMPGRETVAGCDILTIGDDPVW